MPGPADRGRSRDVRVVITQSEPVRPPARVIGTRIAMALHGAWRHEPGAMPLGLAELSPCVDTLVRSGAGALVWRRLATVEWRNAPQIDGLRRAHHIDLMRASLNARHVESVLSGMRAAGMDAILLKGWSAATVYAEPALRPLGDIDLLVREEDGPRARAESDVLSVGRSPVDLHTELLDLTDRSTAELFERSRMIALGGIPVRVPGWEDQLRHLCLHFFRHAGSRPLWLCDIAATLETLPSDFDWDLCLAGDRLLTERVIAAVNLARTLLGARPACPIPGTWRHELPAWLPRALLQSWGATFDARVYRPTAMSLSRGDPREIIPALMRRWPNPLEATVQRSASLAGAWRPLVQIQEAAARVLRFLRSARAFTPGRAAPRAVAR